jgi:hypothetical protein
MSDKVQEYWDRYWLKKRYIIYQKCEHCGRMGEPTCIMSHMSQEEFYSNKWGVRCICGGILRAESFPMGEVIPMMEERYE